MWVCFSVWALGWFGFLFWGFFGGRGEYNKNISVKQQLKKRLIGDVLHSEGPWVVYLYRKDWGVGGWEVPKS